VQVIGGGLASGEANKINDNTRPGTHIMVAGIVFQLFSTITVFVFCAADFIRRTIRRHLLQSLSGSIPLLGAMILSVICIYIQSIYRAIELSHGWSGFPTAMSHISWC